MAKCRSIIALAGILTIGSLPAAVYAGTEMEYRDLRNWCAARDKWTEEGRKTPFSTPDGYFHFHHYCRAVRWMNDSFKFRKEEDKRHAFVNVHNSLQYVLDKVPGDHFLIPEVYAVKGSAFVLEGKKAQAESALVRAHQLDPSHVDANITLARIYMETNRKERATDLVRRGLAAAPDSKSLLRLAKDVGIPESEITAIIEDATMKAAEKAAAGGAEQERAASAPTETKHETKQAEPPVNSAPAASSEPPKIGSPTNPYCRFCPD